MQIGNANRLFQMAQKRKAMAPQPINTDPTWPEPCVQCNGPAITKHTDLETGTTTYWCATDWDHWWVATTYLPQLRDGTIRDVNELFVRPETQLPEDSSWQLEGWPN